LAQNNPVTNFLNGFNNPNEQLQQQNPIQSFFSNLNPFNLFSGNNNNNNRPTLLSDQYVSTMSPPYLNGNLDSSVFSNDHFLNPNQFADGSQYISTLQSANFRPGLSKPTPIYNPNYGQASYSGPSTTFRPGYNQGQYSGSNVMPYSQLYRPQNPSAYPVYQNPYQNISPLGITSNYNKKKTSKTGKRKNNKNKVDVETDSDWFNEFLDKRKEASLDVSSRRPAKKDSDEEVDLEDYFR
jgi:hypothetical protein